MADADEAKPESEKQRVEYNPLLDVERGHLKDECVIIPDGLWRIDARIIAILNAANIRTFGDLRKWREADIRTIPGLRMNDQILVEKFRHYLGDKEMKTMAEMGIKPGIDLSPKKSKPKKKKK